MKKNKSECRLQIWTDDQLPNIVTQMTGIDATKTIVKGSEYINSSGQAINGVYNEKNVWILHAKKIEDYEGDFVSAALHSLLDMLDENKDVFINVFSIFKTKSIFVSGYDYDYHQYFCLSRETIARLGQFDIDVEFDYYYFDEET